MLYPHNFLLPSGINGGLCTLLLFLFSFTAVHLAKYAKIGWQARQTPPKDEKPSTPESPKKEAPAPPSEPIYYIVERKKARAKHRYSEPREIRFKEK